MQEKIDRMGELLEAGLLGFGCVMTLWMLLG